MLFSDRLLGKHDRKDQPLTESIHALCQDAQYDHDFRVKNDLIRANSLKVKNRIKQWLARPAQSPVQALTGGLDWKPGPWLSSWESSLPPNPPRYFNDCRTCLLTGEKEPEDIVEDDDYFWANGYYDNAAEIAKNLVACWPNPPVEISKCIGITLRELQWFTSGKAPLDRHTRFDLEELLGIGYDESMCRYRGAGPYVLVARKPKALEEAYENLSNGGDASPFEIVPSQGTADPSWRYVLINTYGNPPSILMSPRGEKISERLPELLSNYAGIKPVSPEFYRDVVSTCARASREPATNIREMKNFVKRYEEHWMFEEEIDVY